MSLGWSCGTTAVSQPGSEFGARKQPGDVGLDPGVHVVEAHGGVLDVSEVARARQGLDFRTDFVQGVGTDDPVAGLELVGLGGDGAGAGGRE